MPDYGNYCPIALATDVVADRWTPLILRELILGNTRFNDIARCLPGISRSLLAQRLRHLERKGVVELWPSPTGRGNEYHLTPAGRDLERVVLELGRWAVQWLYEDLRPHEVDPTVLMWWMHRRIDTSALPPQRVVVEFRFTAPERVTIWMVLEHGSASVCLQHPGFEPDVFVTTSTPTLGEVFAGTSRWADAVRDESIVVSGPSALTRGLARWFLWSPFADAVRTREKQRP